MDRTQTLPQLSKLSNERRENSRTQVEFGLNQQPSLVLQMAWSIDSLQSAALLMTHGGICTCRLTSSTSWSYFLRAAGSTRIEYAAEHFLNSSAAHSCRACSIYVEVSYSTLKLTQYPCLSQIMQSPGLSLVSVHWQGSPPGSCSSLGARLLQAS